MTIKVGDRVPNATLRQVTPDGPKPVETKDYFAGRKVVLFGLPAGRVKRGPLGCVAAAPLLGSRR